LKSGSRHDLSRAGTLIAIATLADPEPINADPREMPIFTMADAFEGESGKLSLQRHRDREEEIKRQIFPFFVLY